MREHEKNLPVATQRIQDLLDVRLPLLRRALRPRLQENVLHQLTDGLHPSEVARMIQALDTSLQDVFVQWLKPHLMPEIFSFLEEGTLEHVLSVLPVKEIASALAVMDGDDALSLLFALDECKQKEVLAALPSQKRTCLTMRMMFPPNSAGRLMSQEFISFLSSWTVQESMEYIRQHQKNVSSAVYDAFVVDDNGCPVGIVSILTIIKAAKNTLLTKLMQKDFHTIPAQWDQEEVAFVFRLYDLVSAPVINHKNQLVGQITLNNIMEVIEQEATEDLMYIGRLHSLDFHAPVLSTSLSRVHWLVVTLLNTLLTSLVINQFQDTLQQKLSLTILMPIAAAMGGNAGIQTSTVAIRALATRELTIFNAFRTILKEIRVALLNGVLFATFLCAVCFVWFADDMLALILGLSVIFNMLWAGAVGTLLPIMIAKLGYDPALSAGPLLTTTTDILGYAIFLGLASMLL